MSEGHKQHQQKRDIQRLQFSIADIAVLFIIPALLIVVYLTVPTEIQDQLAFAYDNPSLLSMWTGSLIHSDESHLIGNIVGYISVILIVYILYGYYNRQKRFWISTVVVLAVVPPLTAIVDYWFWYGHLEIADDWTSRGFSDVVFGIGGMLLFAVWIFLDREYSRFRATSVLLLIIFLAEGAMIIRVLDQLPIFVIVLWMAGTFVTIYGSVPWKIVRHPRRLHIKFRKNFTQVLLILSAALTLILFITQFLIVDPVRNGAVINFVAHTAGFAIGFFSSVIIWIIMSRTID